MVNLIKAFLSMVNNIHDKILHSSQLSKFSDKQLHFIIIGIIGIIIFSVTQFIFKRLAKYSITAISFIYTMTVLLVIVFGIEIEQKITGRGKMEFGDILAGVYGFLYVFLIYVAIRLIAYIIKRILEKDDEEKTSTKKTNF